MWKNKKDGVIKRMQFMICQHTWVWWRQDICFLGSKATVKNKYDKRVFYVNTIYVIQFSFMWGINSLNSFKNTFQYTL